MNNETNFDVIVVGAGAAGTIAAGNAAKLGASVLVIDKNAKVARKVMITGKGRCNVTNNCDRERLMLAVKRNPRFLYSAFDTFTPQDVMEFFEQSGVPLKTERGQRVFPVSDKAMDIVDALASFVKKNGAMLMQGCVSSLLIEDGVLCGVKLADNRKFYAKSVIVATGGLSYPLTGSTGDGYKLAKQAGHTVTKLLPSLTAIVTKDKWRADLMGLSLKNVTLTIKKGKHQVTSEIGEMMFTHFGVSGPLVLTASGEIDGSAEDYQMFIDLKPGLDLQQLDTRILRDFEQTKNKEFKNALDKLLPKRLIPIVIKQSEIPPLTQVNSITKEQRQKLCSVLKAFAITPYSLRDVEEAVVTRGGVEVKEVSPKTMESKLLAGLFFAGEVLDLDAVTGGFNLQIAFSTGHLAGVNAAQNI